MTETEAERQRRTVRRLEELRAELCELSKENEGPTSRKLAYAAGAVGNTMRDFDEELIQDIREE